MFRGWVVGGGQNSNLDIQEKCDTQTSPRPQKAGGDLTYAQRTEYVQMTWWGDPEAVLQRSTENRKSHMQNQVCAN